MAKASKETKAPEQAQEEQQAPAKMSKKEAEMTIAKFRGINGVKIAELEEAKKVLKG